MAFPLHLRSVALPLGEVWLYAPLLADVEAGSHDTSHPFPYWAKLWPAAVTLATFVEAQPVYVKGKEVLELGAGLGLPSLVAARHAAKVLCTDVVEEAVKAVRCSATHNRLDNLHASVLDWNHLPPDLSTGVLLLSDVNYEPAAFAGLQQTVHAFLQRGSTVLLSTPQRLVAKAFISPVLPYCRHQTEQRVDDTDTSLFVLKK